jgi:hypothetical protein
MPDELRKIESKDLHLLPISVQGAAGMSIKHDLLAHIREQERVIEGLRADKERLDWLIENRASLWNSQYKDRAAIDAVRGGPNA